jgi:cytochrome c oxidase cbb3-type subunit 4|tara:strand:- start:505 stop:714 length:210 start_codon:yes stop_codon:yes gene_type:complete
MDTYSLLREFADSWVLLAMFAFFIGAAIWAFLPSQSKARDEASMIPLRDDPVATEASTSTAAPKGSDDG